MSRANTPTQTETNVLIKSARRCAVCYGMSHDLREQLGQIAHLDQDSSNSAEDNLAYLCFDHHSLYDSKTSQHKNYTLAEVKHLRDALYAAIHNKEHVAPATPPGLSHPSEPKDVRFFNERRALPDTDLIKSIWQRPHWRILIQPEEFLPGQFRSPNECESFAKRSVVVSLGSDSLPIIVAGTALQRSTSPACVRAETDYADMPALCEAWALFQSAQFVLTRPLPVNRPSPKVIHHLEILRVVTQAFAFGRRLALECDIHGSVTHCVSLKNVQGHEILVPNRFPSTHCKADSVTEVETFKSDDGPESVFDRALNLALRIYKQFGWRDAPVNDLRREQRRAGL